MIQCNTDFRWIAQWQQLCNLRNPQAKDVSCPTWLMARSLEENVQTDARIHQTAAVFATHPHAANYSSCLHLHVLNKQPVRLATERLQVRLLAVQLSRNNDSGQDVHTCAFITEQCNLQMARKCWCSPTGKLTVDEKYSNGSVLLGLWRSMLRWLLRNQYQLINYKNLTTFTFISWLEESSRSVASMKNKLV